MYDLDYDLDFPPPAILNCAIATTDGIYEMSDLSLEEAKKILSGEKGFISAIGHQSTAEILTELLGITVAVNRIQFQQLPNQTAVIFKLDSRPPEGKILSRQEIEKIGYSFKRLYRPPAGYSIAHD